VCAAAVCCSTPRGCRGSTPLLFSVRVLGTSWDKGCMARPLLVATMLQASAIRFV
jgi:hypothetical protein